MVRFPLAAFHLLPHRLCFPARQGLVNLGVKLLFPIVHQTFFRLNLLAQIFQLPQRHTVQDLHPRLIFLEYRICGRPALAMPCAAACRCLSSANVLPACPPALFRCLPGDS